MGVIDEIKDRLEITAVVSDYVSLQKSGKNFKACCPFHIEKTPSFFVFPERQSWHCFGSCGTGGDLFSFVMKMEHMDFGEALRHLAQKAGIPLSPREGKEAEDNKKRLFAANQEATEFYRQVLFSARGKRAREYLAERGITTATMEVFRLGYSPEGWDELSQHLRTMGFSSTEIVAAGLVQERDSGSFDLFRGRVMFPINDAQGRVLGFGGRTLGEATPKYLNSPQTPLFDKGSTLYGLHLAREALRQEDLAIVVEGYMDVLMAHQEGFKNVVASLGTALSERHITALKRYTKKLALALDPDAAGREAILRGLQVARQSFDQKLEPRVNWRGLPRLQPTLDAEIRIILLPESKDPDEVIHESPQHWRELVSQAPPMMDYLFDSVASSLDLTNPQQKSRAVEELLPLILEVGDRIQEAHYLQRLARRIRVDEKTLQEAARGLRRRQPRGRTKEEEATPVSLPPHRDRLEDYCLALLLRYPELDSQGLAPEDFDQTAHREIYSHWQREPDPETFSQSLDPGLRDELERLQRFAFPELSAEQRAKALRDCLRRFEERRLRRLKAQEAVLLSQAEATLGATNLAQVTFASWKEGKEPDEAGAVAEAAQLQQTGIDIATRLERLLKEQRNG